MSEYYNGHREGKNPAEPPQELKISKLMQEDVKLYIIYN